MSSCRYCTLPVVDDQKWLPLECRVCNKQFHLHCLNSERKPPALLGDQLFDFCCSFCSSNGKERWARLNLNWVHVIYLALYNLMISSADTGREGYFRWNTGICKYIEKHWSDLMPMRHKTSSWQCTVAGILSVNCPTYFCSGTQVLGESGWWSLQQKVPLKLKDVSKMLSGKSSGKIDTTEFSRKRSLECVIEEFGDPTTGKKLKEHDNIVKDEPLQNQIPSFDECSSQVIVPFTDRQEQILLNFLSSHSSAVLKYPPTARLMRKLKVRQKKRELGRPVFDLDKFVKQSLESTEHYISSDQNEFPIPLKSSTANISTSNYDVENVTSLPFSSTVKAKSILNRVSLPHIPLVLSSSPIENTTFISPYTSHVLLPHIFRSNEFLPPKVKILQELVSKVSCGSRSYQIQSVTFSYFRKHHLTFVNSLVSYFFWPVNLNEYLQYPDFTVIALYGKLVIGCGFMTPDVSVSEAYIPFLLVHPDFCCCGIGQIMLYHLIQSCQGKDITLHVSVDNPAMLLYQKFGFKVEQFCINFYDKYYPPDHYLSKHAFFMRLRR